MRYSEQTEVMDFEVLRRQSVSRSVKRIAYVSLHSQVSELVAARKRGVQAHLDALHSVKDRAYVDALRLVRTALQSGVGVADIDALLEEVESCK